MTRENVRWAKVELTCAFGNAGKVNLCDAKLLDLG